LREAVVNAQDVIIKERIAELDACILQLQEPAVLSRLYVAMRSIGNEQSVGGIGKRISREVMGGFVFINNCHCDVAVFVYAYESVVSRGIVEAAQIQLAGRLRPAVDVQATFFT
jgi:hypothetical protein